MPAQIGESLEDHLPLAPVSARQRVGIRTAMSRKQDTKLLKAGKTLPVESRVWVRYPGTMSVAVHVLGCDTERGWWAKVKNASLGGVCILSPRRVPQGTRLLFELPAGEVGRAREAMLMRVLHASEDDFCDWLMDCVFVRRFNEEELRTLRLPPPPS